MKHLRVYFVVAMLAVAVFEGGIPTSVAATTTPVVGTPNPNNLNSYTKEAAVSVLDELINYLQPRQTDATLAATYGGLSSPRFQDYMQENSGLIARLEEGKQILSEEYDRVIATGTNPAVAYNASLTRVLNVLFYIGQDVVLRSNIPAANNDITKITTTLRLAARENIDTLNYSPDNADRATGDALQRATYTAAASAPSTTKPMQCEWYRWTMIGCINNGLTWIIKSVLIEIVGFALWVSTNLLNYAMYHGIFFFKNFVPDDIYQIWLVIRKAISLFVFFAGLYVGFMAIIGKSEDFKRYIVALIIFGLFVNFSYPIVKVFVDISNVVSLQVYQTTMGREVLANQSSNSAGALIMAKMGLQGLVASATAEGARGQLKFTEQITTLPGALAAVGFVGYAAYIFFMAAFLIIMRTALLVCILAASPLLLVDTVVPALGNAAKWLRTTFLSQLFVAPVFALMLALTIKFMDVFSTTDISTTNSVDSVAVFFNLIMMIVMLHIMLKVTKAVSGQVGEAITKFAGKAGGLGTGLAFGAGAATLGFAGRKSLGKFGEMLGPDSKVGQMLAKSKYDLRNLGAVQSGAGALGVYGMGQGAKKNRKETEDEYNKEVLETAQQLEGDDAEKYLQKKFTSVTGNIPIIGKYTGARAADNKAYQTLQKEDKSTLKQYVSADEERRKEMMEDDKNKRFRQRFGRIDRGDLEGMHDDVKKAYEDKKARKEADEVRNTNRVAGYMTADQGARESMYANALASNDKELLQKLDLLNNLIAKNRPVTAEDLAALGDRSLSQKILTNQTAQTEAKAQGDAAIKRARESSEIAVQTNANLGEIASAQKETNELLQRLLNSEDYAKRAVAPSSEDPAKHVVTT